VTVVSDSSPLITLSKIDSFELIRKLYGTLVISSAVYAEVVVAGEGLAGAAETLNAPWINVRHIKPHSDLSAAQIRFGLGIGELSQASHN
jgi:predicted nucleic acid-binding protein